MCLFHVDPFCQHSSSVSISTETAYADAADRLTVLEDYSFIILVGTMSLSLIYIFLLDEYAVNMPAKETTPRHLRICA